MRTTIRRAGVACGTALASLAVALSTVTGASASNSAVVIGGIKVPTMSDLLMAPLLGGVLKNQERVSVNWPAQAGPYSGSGDMSLGASIRVGIPNLTAAINTALGKLSRDADGNVLNGEKVTVVGLSAGSLVVNEVMRNMVTSGELPDPDEITFIVAEDSSRQKLIKDAKYSSKFDYTYRPPPVTPYDVVVITGEYDGMADMPDRPWNFLAMANAMAGAVLVHVPVMYCDLSKVPEENITVTVNSEGGTTTHYLVPTKVLPLVQMNPRLKSREAELKAKIDKGYSRNDIVTTASATTLVAAEPTAEESEPTEPAADPADPAARRSARAEARVEAAAARREARADSHDSSSDGAESSDSSGSTE